jgi:hypothetical protein
LQIEIEKKETDRMNKKQTPRVLERAPGVKERAPFPAQDAVATINPPAFRWLTHPGVAAWKVTLQGPGKRRMDFGPLIDPILALPGPLAQGTWRWHYTGLDAAGHEVGRSLTRAFTVPAGVPGIVVPTAAELLRRMRGQHPRLLADRIAAARRQYRRQPTGDFRRLAAWCRLAENEPLIAEPADYRPFNSDTEEYNEDWVRIFSAGKVGSAHAARFALSFLLTDNPKHLELAKRWALHLVSWNPFGTTSATNTDEASMPMLERLSWVYDWLRPYWTDDERRRYRACMQARGQEVLLKYRQIEFAAKPYNNHMCRQLGFLGSAGIAFLGEIPEAEEWTNYVLRVLAVSYPGASWGSDDGGWSNGVAYWTAYMTFLYTFITVCDELGINLMSAPYYRNTGYFAVYHLPPYAPRGGFGDSANAGPGFGQKLVVGAFGRIARDPMLCAYAEAIRVPTVSPAKHFAKESKSNPSQRWDAWSLGDLLAVLLVPKVKQTLGDLRRLPAARQFPAIGWASMHTALGDAKNDAWLEFKSGPFGSVSHSHADQNAFNLNAYGKALLIDSGYYPWYGSPHDTLWSRQTWAHNAMLVGGHGQPVFDWDARGKIHAFAQVAPFAYARGEAAEAYNRPASGEALEQAERHCPRMLKIMGPATKVIRASRAVLMVNGDRPFFVVLDWLEVETPVKFQWLAHAFHRMSLQAAAPGFLVRNEPAWLAVQFVTPGKLRLTQTDQFAGVPPEGRAKGSPNEWHLTAETLAPATTARFMTVLVPGRKGDALPKIKKLRGEGTIGVQIGNARVLAPEAGMTGLIRYADVDARAALVAVCGNALIGAEATQLKWQGRTLLETDAPRTWIGK